MSTESSVLNFLNRTLVIDGHFDLLMDVQVQREKGRTKVIEMDYLPRFIEGEVNVVVAALFVDSQFLPEKALSMALQQISALHQEVEESPEKLMICYGADDMELAEKSGKIGFLLSLEGAEPLGKDLSLLRIFYELGVRNLGLVWSRRNEVGDGSYFQPVREGRKGGITSFGVKVIEEAERLGITIDVSHLNDEGFWDVMEIAKKPVIASHSNSRVLCGTMRNLTDEQIKAIASRNGVIGINAVNMLVGDDDASSHIDQLIHHINHIIEVAGIQSISLGLDLCDDFLKYLSQEDLESMPRKPFDVISTHGQLPQFVQQLVNQGYTEAELTALLGGNLFRLFKREYESVIS